MESTSQWVVRQTLVTIYRKVFRHLLHNTVQTMQISPALQWVFYGKTKKGECSVHSVFPGKPRYCPSIRLLCQTQTEHQMPSRAIYRYTRVIIATRTSEPRALARVPPLPHRSRRAPRKLRLWRISFRMRLVPPLGKRAGQRILPRCDPPA